MSYHSHTGYGVSTVETIPSPRANWQNRSDSYNLPSFFGKTDRIYTFYRVSLAKQIGFIHSTEFLWQNRSDLFNLPSFFGKTDQIYSFYRVSLAKQIWIHTFYRVSLAKQIGFIHSTEFLWQNKLDSYILPSFFRKPDICLLISKKYSINHLNNRK